MKIAVWKTGHEIADRVAGSIIQSGIDHVAYTAVDNVENIDADIHIGYGILRGMDDVFRACDRLGRPWFNIDKGYWKPGHYDGYYRISLGGTQQTTFNGLEPDYAFISDNVDCVFRREMRNTGRKILVCPPTEHVAKFFGVDIRHWETMNAGNTSDYLFRRKGCERPLQHDLDQCSKVVTFNSSVGWEALRQGIEVVSDPIHSIVGAYQKFIDKPLHLDFNKRCKFFAIQASLQLTLSEMRNGLLWPLLQKLLGSTSDMIAEKQLPRTWQRIASQGELMQTPASNS